MVWHFSGLLFLMVLRSRWDYPARCVTVGKLLRAGGKGRAERVGRGGTEVWKVEVSAESGKCSRKCPEVCNLYQSEGA